MNLFVDNVVFIAVSNANAAAAVDVVVLIFECSCNVINVIAIEVLNVFVDNVVFIAVANAVDVNVVLNIFLGNVTDLNAGCE